MSHPERRASRPGDAPPPVSVVLATLSGWSAIRTAVGALARQADEVRGEVIVADGSGGASPARDLPPRVTWLTLDGAGIFDLRLAALRRALGDVVIVTEDHCLAPANWCRHILDLHERHPDADIVQGRVDNASRTTRIDWASYLVNQSAHVPPIDPAGATRQVGIVGVSLKRRALDTLLRAHPQMPPELVPTPELRSHDFRVHVDETLRLDHVQSETWLGHAALHFHTARAIAGVRRRHMKARDWIRVVAAPVLAPWRASRVVARGLRRNLPRRTVLGAAPGVVWLYVSKGIGECVGYLAGPGDSARRLH
jgi:hypothetical protein